MMWDDTADALLIELWDRGGSLQYVADGLLRAGYDKVSRNSIAGRKFRLATSKAVKFKRPPHSQAVASLSFKPPPSKRIRKPRSSIVTLPKPRVVTSIDVLIDDLKTHQGVEYLENNGIGCKALMDHLPRSGEWALHRVCGKPRIDDGTSWSPYCRAHAALYTNPNLRRA